MSSNTSLGFTLVELLLVVVIVGMLATVAVPSFMKAKEAANSSAAVADLRTIHTTQTMYRIQNNRYGQLSEINSFSDGSLGKISGLTLRRNEFVYMMLPTPTDASLRTGYQVIAYHIIGGRIASQYEIKENGVVETVIP